MNNTFYINKEHKSLEDLLRDKDFKNVYESLPNDSEIEIMEEV
ncbi:hypothetical protein [Clostridium sp.]